MKSCYCQWGNEESCKNAATKAICTSGGTFPICDKCAERLMLPRSERPSITFIIPVAEISSETFANLIKSEVAEKQKH